MSMDRGFTIGRMRWAQREGWNVSRFVDWARVEGISYRYQDMLSDWRTIAEEEEKSGKLRYVSPNKYPTSDIIQESTFRYDKDWCYTVRVREYDSETDEITERFAGVLSDYPLTRGEVESTYQSAYEESELYGGKELLDVTAWTAKHSIFQEEVEEQ